jgi:hypothetical protein
MGGWPVLDPSWSADENWQIEQMLGYVRKRYNAAIIMESWVSPDDMNSSVNIAQVRI